jgi:hypothetical protein
MRRDSSMVNRLRIFKNGFLQKWNSIRTKRRHIRVKENAYLIRVRTASQNWPVGRFLLIVGVIENNRDFLQFESLLYTSSKVEGNSHLYRNSGFQLMCSIPVTQQGH